MPPASDPARLAEAILGVLDDPAQRAAMGAAGRARVKQSFTRERMLRQTYAIYEELRASKWPAPEESSQRSYAG
ncbi:MAG: glycosyltransferase [Planctomycetaceae bacterium]|nr:glycosyltransferase [Planctomycetaceae bacterium]